MSKEQKKIKNKNKKPSTNLVFTQNKELYGSATVLAPIFYFKQIIHLVKISSKRQQNTCD